MTILNVSAYKFVDLNADQLVNLREQMKAKADELQLKGTVLLSTEGINLFLAAASERIGTFKEFLSQWPVFADLWFKESYSDYQPFTRMLVRIKKEIIAMGKDEIKPAEATVPHLEPEQLQQWYDAKKEMIILDTRNDYEVELGTFENAIHLDLETFRQFPDAIKKLPEAYKNKTVVTFCTGGVRCEKAGQWLKNQGFNDVYQLNGGILNYLEKCGGAHYQGECFVFDKRVAVDAQLKETTTKQCYACRQPISIVAQNDEQRCPHCDTIGAIG